MPGTGIGSFATVNAAEIVFEGFAAAVDVPAELPVPTTGGSTPGVSPELAPWTNGTVEKVVVVDAVAAAGFG